MGENFDKGTNFLRELADSVTYWQFSVIEGGLLGLKIKARELALPTSGAPCFGISHGQAESDESAGCGSLIDDQPLLFGSPVVANDSESAGK